MTLLYLNGKYMPLEEGRVSVEDRGFQLADGVYEVIRTYRGRLFRLDRHLARLGRSLDGLRIPLPEPLPRIEEVCRKVAEGIPDATIYLQVTRGAAPRVHAFPAGDLRPTFVAYARPTPVTPDSKTFALCTVPDDRWGRCHLKTIGLLANVLGKQRALEAGCDEGLFYRDDGFVTEGCTSNAFMVKAGKALTHPANHRILGGVTRDGVIEVIRQEGVPLEERPFSLAEALAAEEFFMTGTGAEVMPAVTIDGKAVGDGRPGPVTLRLRAAFRDLIRRECP